MVKRLKAEKKKKNLKVAREKWLTMHEGNLGRLKLTSQKKQQRPEGSKMHRQSVERKENVHQNPYIQQNALHK